MGAIRFSLDPHLVATILSHTPIQMLVETGTYKGDTVAEFEGVFKKIVSIELSQELFMEAQERFCTLKHVEILQGHSPEKLSELRSKQGSTPTLYWLDAHWCAGADAAGDLSQCPLLEELRAVGQLHPLSVVLIDDARLFLCSPSGLHRKSDWPHFHQVVHHLLAMSGNHNLVVVNDVIAFFPSSIQEAMDEYARSYGVDWLEVNNKSKANEDWIKRMEEKERVIQSQAVQLQEKEMAISQLHRGLEELTNNVPQVMDGKGAPPKKIESHLRTMERRIGEHQALLEGSVSKAIESCQILKAIVQEYESLKVVPEMMRAEDGAHVAPPKDEGKSRGSETVTPAMIQEESSELVEEIQRLREEQFRLIEEIEQKEHVIRQQDLAIKAFKMAVWPLWPIIQTTKRLSLARRSIKNVLRPRLGNLAQYSPRPISNAIISPPPRNFLRGPRISIVTPSFQQGKYIERTIQSVIGQKYHDLEYYVQDGGSTDETVQVLKGYEKEITGWTSERDSGQSEAINRGFARTNGEIMAWLNSDDLLLPNALATVAEYFEKHPEVDVVYGNRLLVDEEDMEIGEWVLPGHDGAALSWADYVPQETLFWRRRVWDKVGGALNESFRFAMDWDLLVRFIVAEAKFAHIPKFLGAFRIHEHQKTSAAIDQLGYDEMNRIRERMLGNVPNGYQIRKALMPFMFKHLTVDILHRVKKVWW